MKIFTIGYTQKSAKEFFEILQKNQVDILVDIRLSNTGQLAGFTKRQDLEYFLSLFKISYEYWKDFTPTKEIRDNYLKSGNWSEYKKRYNQLISQRKAIENVDFTRLKDKKIALLCSEPKADRCHRILVAEKMAKRQNVEIVHI